MQQLLDKIVPCAIFTRNSTCKCKLKGKLEVYGFCPKCISGLDELLDFLFENDKGLVFVDSNSYRLNSYIIKYAKKQITGNVSFVFLNDNNDFVLDCDNVFSFISSYDRIDSTIELIYNKGLFRKKHLDNIPEVFIDKELSKILNEYCFPKSFNGYSYIKDCVHIMLSIENAHLTLNQVYDIVALKYEKNASVIEKGIRQIISVVVDNSSVTIIKDIGVNKLSNLKLLKYLIEYIKSAYCDSMVS